VLGFTAICGSQSAPSSRNLIPSKYEGVGATVGVLDTVHIHLMADRLSILLSATVGAFTLAARAAGHPAYQAEYRHDWDALLYRFYVGADEIISPNVLSVSH
jgi:formate hydrogenlyase subunit 3/multisubunit Na+/H+ antiporter MnhD subunit